MINTMPTMYTSVMGRVREMAVLQVTGYRRRDVLAGFLVEGVVLSLIGGLVGCLFGLLAYYLGALLQISVFLLRLLFRHAF